MSGLLREGEADEEPNPNGNDSAKAYKSEFLALKETRCVFR